MTASPEARLAGRHIIVSVGSGGVGKTTAAAAIALQAARAGRRALVLTIDPARRLADALGLHPLGNTPREVPRELQSALGVSEPGAMFAMMLDMKGTFDDLVERLASDEHTRARILANPIYQHVSDALAGSAEYAAMEKVYEMASDPRFDLVVLDTPPSQHALDFLDAPRRLLDFLDSRLVRLLVHPTFSAGRFGLKLFHGATQRALQLVERISGIGFLEDISEFLLAFEDMSEGFSERARRVQTLLLGEKTGFVLVAGPAPESVYAATRFLDRLAGDGIPMDGIVVNRMHTWPGPGAPPEWLREGTADAAGASAVQRAQERLTAALQPGLSPALAREVAHAAVDATRGYAEVVHRDAECIAPLRRRATNEGLFFRCVPERERDVHDLEGLGAIADHLFAGHPFSGSPSSDSETAAPDTGARTEDAERERGRRTGG